MMDFGSVRGFSRIPPEAQLTIVKIDNKQNNNRKTNKLTADNLQQITCRKIICKKGKLQRWSA